MALTKVIAGPNGSQTFELTAEEETARDAEQLAYANEAPIRQWITDIQATDNEMPRWFEDAVTEGSVVLQPGRVKDNYDAKVALRGTKP